MDALSAVILIALAAILLWALTHFRRRATTKLQAVMEIISSVNDNLNIMSTWAEKGRLTGKFRTAEWSLYGDKLDFLDPSLVSSLKESYSLMTRLNEKYDLSRINSSGISLQDVPADVLKQLLTAGKDGLADWLKNNTMHEMQGRRW